MPPRHPRQPAPAVEEPVPPYYVATEHLPHGGPGAATVWAFTAGDHVPPELVRDNNWGALVEVPEEFRGVLEPPPAPTPVSGGEDKETET